jgi:type II secretory pathway component PulM
MQLSQRDKKILRYAVIGIPIYLLLFYGLVGWKKLETRRADYQRLLTRVRDMKQTLDPYETKLLLIEKLRGTSGVDPSKLTRATVVARASADLQKAAGNGGIKLGPVRETQGSANKAELASMQFEAIGPVNAITSLIHKIETLGYPLIIDSLELSVDPREQGKLKLNVQLVILDFEQWKKERKIRAA